MEGVPTFEKREETGENWRSLKAEAPEKAKVLIAGIDGFEGMNRTAQFDALEKLIERLADEGNQNRFAAAEIARCIALLKEKERHDRIMSTLGAE